MRRKKQLENKQNNQSVCVRVYDEESACEMIELCLFRTGMWKNASVPGGFDTSTQKTWSLCNNLFEFRLFFHSSLFEYGRVHTQIVLFGWEIWNWLKHGRSSGDVRACVCTMCAHAKFNSNDCAENLYLIVLINWILD